MASSALVESIAVGLGIRPDKLKLQDVQGKIPSIRRMVDKYEKQAIQAEKTALTARAKAYSPETPAGERARLMRSAAQTAEEAKRLGQFAATFLTQLGNYTALETTMRIVEQMRSVGLFGDTEGAVDWQAALDGMQIEIRRLTDMCAKLGVAMSSALSQVGEEESAPEVDSLNALFEKWDKEQDPVKKAEIQKEIDKAANMALA